LPCPPSETLRPDSIEKSNASEISTVVADPDVDVAAWEPLTWEEALSASSPAWEPQRYLVGLDPSPGRVRLLARPLQREAATPATVTLARSPAAVPVRRGFVRYARGISSCLCCAFRWRAPISAGGQLRYGTWSCPRCRANGSWRHGDGCLKTHTRRRLPLR
jgi:hypothetical protein